MNTVRIYISAKTGPYWPIVVKQIMLISAFKAELLLIIFFMVNIEIISFKYLPEVH